MGTTVLLIAWLGCQGADLTTTTIAMRKGAVEQNVLVRGGRLYPLKISVNLSGVLLWRHGKTATQRNIVAGTFAVAGCVPAVLNTRNTR